MERKIPWLKIAVAAAVVATTAVGIALFIKKKLDELKFREEEYDFFDDECEFYDSYNPMDEVVTHEDEEDFIVSDETVEDESHEEVDTLEDVEEKISVEDEEEKEF